jgi:hypothetical protein
MRWNWKIFIILQLIKKKSRGHKSNVKEKKIKGAGVKFEEEEEKKKK